MTISDILRDSDYSLDLLEKHIDDLTIFQKEQKSGLPLPYTVCKVRKKEIKLTPEEVVRQLYLIKLHKEYGYPYERMQLEFAVHFGREVKRADIVIMDKIQPTVPYIIIEVKKPKLKDGKDQLKSYCNSTGATMAIWTNGKEIVYYHRKDPNYFEPIPNIPSQNQSLKDILTERVTIDDLIKIDILKTQRRSLKNIILDMEDEVLANAGVDVFEEVFKLVFIKLFDELQNTRKLSTHLEFRNYGESDSELKVKIEEIFAKAKKQWGGIFNDDEKIRLTPSHLSVCVSSLQDVKLFNSNLDVIDDAFEYLVNKTSKGEKGQYFTPRYVIDMCVKMLNPQEEETMIDTASGSCGFPIHTVFEVWRKIYKDLGIEESHLFTAEKKHERALEYVREKVFGIDFDDKSVRVSRMLNIIAGDGHTNVLNLNSLDFSRWEETTKDESWQDIYFDGWRRLKKLRSDKNSDKSYEFDIVMANPPFAGDIKESHILHQYELGKNASGKFQTKVGRDILFIERNLEMLKNGGRMAVVLPQGRFNNSSDKYIRDFIATKCRILAVVGLHGNVFKPHTGTKTSVLFVQKWDEKLCPKKEDYPIFFATMQKSSKDNSGDKIYVKNSDGSNRLDSHDHLIVEHDLYNHDGITQDGIAEAFLEFAKKEGLSFASGKCESPFDEAKYRALLDGLEAVELKLSEVLEDNDRFRINSEFFRKKYIIVKNKLESLDSNHLFDYYSFNARYGQPIYDENSTLKVLNSQYVRDYFLDYESAKTGYGEIVPKEAVLINATGVGTLGRVNINYLNDSFSVDNHVNVIIAKNINPYYLTIFLKSYYGQSQINRYYSGSSGQIEIYAKDFNNFLVPIFSNNFQSGIELLVKSSYQKLLESKSLYKESEELLLQELDLLDFKPSDENIAVKSFQESFGNSGRLDSEYYQPKYDELLKHIKKTKFDRLGNIVKIKKSIEPGSEAYQNEGIPFVRVANVTKFGITDTDIYLTKDMFSEKDLKQLHPTKETILLSKDGTVGIAYKIKNETDIITSGALLHLTIKRDDVFSEYLTLVLNSLVVQLQAQRYAGGSIIQHWKPSEVEEILIPIIDQSIQAQIEEKIKKSFELKEESKRLLDLAKRAVETAIEESEERALEMLR